MKRNAHPHHSRSDHSGGTCGASYTARIVLAVAVLGSIFLWSKVSEEIAEQKKAKTQGSPMVPQASTQKGESQRAPPPPAVTTMQTRASPPQTPEPTPMPAPPTPIGDRPRILPKFLKDPRRPWPSHPQIRLGTSLEHNDIKSPFDEYKYIMQSDHNHRNLWEFAAIMHAIDRMGGVRKGCRGLGFDVQAGVPLSTYFVTRGCKLTITAAKKRGANHIAHTYNSAIQSAPPVTEYVKNVSLTIADMNDLPEVLLRGEFDFTFSAGSFEHLGGMNNSIAFFKNQLKALAPGGIAAHTTEFVLSQDTDKNPEFGHMTAFTDVVLRRMLKEVEAMGFEVLPIQLAAGVHANDEVDWGTPSFRETDHWILGGTSKTGPIVHCSMVIVVKRPAILPQFLRDPPRLWAKEPTVRLGNRIEHNSPRSYLQKYKNTFDRHCDHRKWWEWYSIMDAIDRMGGINDGCRGLGFGAGKEPLATYFVKRGCSVLVTDAPQGGEWGKTEQHAGQIEQTYSTMVKDAPPLEHYVKNAAFMAVDMNNIPATLLKGEYDFTWSGGSFEHLGGMEKSIAFFKNALKALKPGGVAAHTTEFVLSQDTDKNPEYGHMTAFTETVLRKMLKDVEAMGYEVPTIDLMVGADGETQIDHGIPNYRSQDIFLLGGQSATAGYTVFCSVLVIAKRPSA